MKRGFQSGDDGSEPRKKPATAAAVSSSDVEGPQDAEDPEMVHGSSEKASNGFGGTCSGAVVAAAEPIAPPAMAPVIYFFPEDPEFHQGVHHLQDPVVLLNRYVPEIPANIAPDSWVIIGENNFFLPAIVAVLSKVGMNSFGDLRGHVRTVLRQIWELNDENHVRAQFFFIVEGTKVPIVQELPPSLGIARGAWVKSQFINLVAWIQEIALEMVPPN